MSRKELFKLFEEMRDGRRAAERISIQNIRGENGKI